MNNLKLIKDVDARWVEKEIEEELVENIVLIQNTEDKNNLFGIIKINEKEGFLISSGNINFNSTHGGKLALKEFRNWLIKNNLLNKVELIFCTSENCKKIKEDKIYNNTYISNSFDSNTKESFNKWRANEKEWN